MALSLLSVGLIVIHSAMREAIAARGQARDFTQARFLLENVIANLELQPQLTEASDSGSFSGDLSRFTYKWKVSRIDVPPPSIPPQVPPEVVQKFKLDIDYLTKIEATVSWSRSGKPFERTFETLARPEKLYIPPKEGLRP